MDSMLEDVVTEMAREVVCELCFEKDAPDIWVLRRRGST